MDANLILIDDDTELAPPMRWLKRSGIPKRPPMSLDCALERGEPLAPEERNR